MERNYEVLLKPNWFASDIQAFYGISKVKAEEIKTKVQKENGEIWLDLDSERKSVKADDVIKAMGGNSRLEEMQIYNLLGKKVKENE